MESLTDEQLQSLKYFWEEKQDLERYIDFERLKPQIKKEHPEILKAWNAYKESIKTMNSVINAL